MPKLKKQAFSQVLLKRNTKNSTDASQRQQMFEKMGVILVNKNPVIKSMSKNNYSEDIEEICLNAQKSLKNYKVKLIKAKVQV